MSLSPTYIYAEILRNDFAAFVHRAFQELYPQSRFIPSWHIDCVAAKLEDVRVGQCTVIRHYDTTAPSQIFYRLSRLPCVGARSQSCRASDRGELRTGFGGQARARLSCADV